MGKSKQTARTSRPSTRRLTRLNALNNPPNTTITPPAPAPVVAPIIPTKSSKKARTSSLYDKIIIIHVGPEQTKFGIHRALLAHHSAYFATALTELEPVAEEDKDTMRLEDEDPEVFSRFNAWLYTGDFRRDEDEGVLLLGPALDLAIFAIEKVVPRLYNAIIDGIIERYSRGPGYHLSMGDGDICVTTWESCDDARLKAFLVDLCLVCLDLEKVVEEGGIEMLPHGLLARIAVRAQRASRHEDEFSTYDLTEWHCERFHRHEVGEVAEGGECGGLERGVVGVGEEDMEED
jgi:hypothetical protein